jgi:predicted ATPase
VRTIRNLETGSVRNPRRTSVDLLTRALSEKDYPGIWADSGLWPWQASPSVFAELAADLDGVGAEAPWPGSRHGSEPLIGRAKELEILQTSIQADRCVVLVGPGGIGKTHLVRAVADLVRMTFRDGVAVVELGTLGPHDSDRPQQHEAVGHAILGAVGAEPRPSAPVRHHREQEKLVVIDTAEHVIESVAVNVRYLLRDFPRVRLVITSRRPISVPFAKTWEVAALDYERADEMPEAVELFVRRVQLSCPTLDLSRRMVAVRELCAKLDGVPLAIELAAHRLRSVSLDTLLRTRAFAGLGRAPSADLPHQRTLLSSVRWSYDLLPQQQRVLLHQLASFSYPFVIEDVDRLLHDSGYIARESSDQNLIDLLSELVDSSLVQVARGRQYFYRIFGYVREMLSGGVLDERLFETVPGSA